MQTSKTLPPWPENAAYRDAALADLFLAEGRARSAEHMAPLKSKNSLYALIIAVFA
jgi:hypothetical protein